MLKNEDQLNEGQGVLVSDASFGLGYQLAGALNRLGRRLGTLSKKSPLPAQPFPFPVALLNEQSLEDLAAQGMEQVRSYSHLVIAHNKSLSLNQTPEHSTIATKLSTLTRLQNHHPDCRAIWFLPSTTNPKDLLEIQNSGWIGTLFLVPALVGFRDLALFSQCMEDFRTHPTSLWLESNPLATKDVGFLPVVDAAAYAVSSILEPVSGPSLLRVVVLEPSVNTLRELQLYLQSNWKLKRPNFLEKMANRLGNEYLGRDLKFGSHPKDTHHNLAKNLHKASVFRGLDLFPTIPTSWPKFLRQSLDYHQRNSALELHFPPSRAL